jgi:hypothetical protein
MGFKLSRNKQFFHAIDLLVHYDMSLGIFNLVFLITAKFQCSLFFVLALVYTFHFSSFLIIYFITREVFIAAFQFM